MIPLPFRLVRLEFSSSLGFFTNDFTKDVWEVNKVWIRAVQNSNFHTIYKENNIYLDEYELKLNCNNLYRAVEFNILTEGYIYYYIVKSDYSFIQSYITRVFKTRELIFASQMRIRYILEQYQQLQKMNFFLLQNRR